MEMETTNTHTVRVRIPQADWSFFNDLAKARGWETSQPTSRKSGLDKALDDLREGRVYHAKDSQELFQQILG